MKNKNSFWFWLISIICLIIVTLIVIKIALPANNNYGNVQVSEEEWIRGNPDAKVTLIEYSDFECPACALYETQVEMLAEEFSNQIKIIYRNFPLPSIHPYAEQAAYAAEAAGVQNKFWQMHDILFSRQAEWADSDNPENNFISYAEDLDLNVDQFKANMKDKDVAKAVSQDVASGYEAGVNYTPSFFLNGTKINNPRSYDKFRNIIQAELDKQ